MILKERAGVEADSVPSILYDPQYFLTDCEGSSEFQKSGGKLLGQRLQLIFSLANMKPNRRVLDIGCGRGEIFAFADAHGSQSVGIDYSLAATKLSRDILKRTHLSKRQKVVSADCKSLPFPAEIFDAVILSDIVEHLHLWELTRMVDEINRVLHSFPNRWHYRIRYPLKRLHARLMKNLALPRNPRSDYEKAMHVFEHTVFSLAREFRKNFKGKLWTVEMNELADRICEDRNIARSKMLASHIWGVFAKRSSDNVLRRHFQELFHPRAVTMGINDFEGLRSGWYPLEEASGKCVRWNKGRSQVILRSDPSLTVLHIRCYAGHPDIHRNPAKISININAAAQKVFQISENKWCELEMPLHISKESERLIITVEVDRTFNPKALNISEDSRDLGLLVERVWLS